MFKKWDKVRYTGPESSRFTKDKIYEIVSYRPPNNQSDGVVWVTNDNLKLDFFWKRECKPLEEPKEISSDGGPANYYDFPEKWKTLNDLMDGKAKTQWHEHSFHLGNICKAVFRWGEKKGTTKNYDARKIVYSGLRVLLMLEGKQSVQKYLKELIEDEQFNL